MLRPKIDRPVTTPTGRVAVEYQPDLGRGVLGEAGGAVLAEHLKHQAIRVAGGDPVPSRPVSPCRYSRPRAAA